uniref:Uncharacterized protein n=1 Tax=Rubinisphaera brasiliensis (strain ATCC 49424 / DSM 5305 / JCM 21570 / IAM 15109 / NBRC 103401 / IFAM 1448) TaxID=756272 RepID=F0SFK7_RUBBR|nr:hypothetical protein Plabr_2868 [Rubinisphaera brasiliensis DSM 5305]
MLRAYLRAMAAGAVDRFHFSRSCLRRFTSEDFQPQLFYREKANSFSSGAYALFFPISGSNCAGCENAKRRMFRKGNSGCVR